MNPFPFSNDNKRYHTLNYHNLNVFGFKIFKCAINAGFSCPNIDGTKSYGGCIFCDAGSGYFTNGSISVNSQIQNELARIHSKYPNAKAIAYFQANTNTYAPVQKLRAIFEPVLNFKDIVGISIGTRADCLDDGIMDYLCELNNKTNLTIELGLQSIHDSTLSYINRGYSHNEFLIGFNKLKKNNIRTCLHIINSLPFETVDMMLDTAYHVGQLSPDAVKIQMLHVISGSKLAEIYSNSHFKLFSMEEYIDVVVRQLELLPSSTVIERVTGDGDKSKLIAPLWSANKIAVLGGIDKSQRLNNSFQGKLFKNA